MTDTNLLAVWWVNQSDCESINEDNINVSYIRKEYDSRNGRAGRGRLWVPKQIKLQQVELPSTVVFEGNDTHGGIVIFKEDVESIRNFGGIISDTAGNLL